MKKKSYLRQKLEQLKSNAEISQILSNTSWLISERVFNLIVGLFVGVWVTRYLGSADYGIYSYALSFSMLFTAFASFGIDTIVIRDLVKFKEKRNVLMGTSFGLKILGSSSSFLISIIVLSFTNLDFSTKTFIWIIIANTIICSFGVIDQYFQSRVESSYVVKTNTTAFIISSVVKIILILAQSSLLGFVLVLLIDSVIKAIGYIYFYIENGQSILEWSFDKSLAKSLVKESWPLVFSGLAISVGMRIDQIMLKSFVEDTELGIYAVGVRLAELFAFIPMVISQSIYPKIIKINFETGRKKLSKIIGYIFYFLIFMSVAITIFGRFGVNLLYGEEFDSSTVVLQILIWTIPVTYLGIITNKLLTVQGLQKIIFAKQFALTLLNISLNLYLIPRFGIIGAAWATLISDILINLFLDLAFNKAKWIYYLKIRALTFYHK